MDIDKIIQIVGTIDFKTLLCIGAMIWWAKHDIKKSIDKLDDDLRAMNTRLGRVEGTVYGKDVYIHTQKE